MALSAFKNDFILKNAFLLASPGPKPLSLKPKNPKTKTKGPWADTKIRSWWNSPALFLSQSIRST